MEEPRGIFPVLQTPFTDDGSAIDFEDLDREVDTVVADGASGIVVFGFATEFRKLSENERDNLLKATIARCAGRIPVIPSVTQFSTELAIEDARRYEEWGADAIMVLPLAGSAVDHVVEVAATVSVPIFMQYIPQVTGTSISVDEFVEMSTRMTSPLHIKAEPKPTGPLISSLLEASHGSIRMYTGNQGRFMYEALERGALGIMPGCSMVAVYAKIYREYVEGSRERAFELYNFLVPYLNAIEGGPWEMIMEKRNLVRRGVFKSEFLRRPRGTADAYTDSYMERYYGYLQSHFPDELPEA